MNVFQAGLSEPDWTRETSRAIVWLRCGRTASEDREGDISKDLEEPGTARWRAVFVLFLFCFYSSSFFLNVNRKSQFPESLVESGGPIHPPSWSWRIQTGLLSEKTRKDSLSFWEQRRRLALLIYFHPHAPSEQE